MSRYSWWHEIEKLDPVTDHQQIVYLSGSYEFPFEIQRALEFALFRTYAVPSIAELLAHTGEFQRAGQKRYDDTSLLIAEITENGYDSEKGRAAIRRMNQMHHRFNISNEDYLYVLSTFVFEPMRWNSLLAWRPYSPKERLANFYFWREVGKRMNIKDIPEDIDEFERFNIEYERQHFRYNEASRKIGELTIEVFANWFPRFLHRPVRWAIYALLDEPLRQAFGFPKMPDWYVKLIRATLRFRAFVVRWMPARKTPFSLTREKNRTYPHGYKIEELGPKIH